MKKFKLLFSIVTVLFLMTGCVKYNATMEIKKDKSMDLKIIYALDTSSFGDLAEEDVSTNSTETISKEQKAELEKKGYKVSEYKDDKYNGVELTYSIKNIDDASKEEEFEVKLSDMLNENSDNNHFFVIKKGFLKNTYKAVYKFETSDSSSSDGLDMSEYLKAMDLNFTVKLPSNAKSNNATKVDGTTYTWDLTKNTTSDINFEFEIYNMTNIYILCGIAALLVIVIIALIILCTKKKKA
jgi:hypothetical protein